jgi:polysaccharide export outer membrane protein
MDRPASLFPNDLRLLGVALILATNLAGWAQKAAAEGDKPTAAPAPVASSPAPAATQTPSRAPQADKAVPGDSKFSYILQPQDLLKVQVFEEEALDRDVRVSQNHTITLPLIGTVDLTNRTVHDAEQLITELYGRDYLVNPQINITVTEYTQRTLNVLGAVNSPGTVLIPPEKELTLVDAIARSGGFSRLANRGRVSLTRKLPGGGTAHYTIDVDKLITGNAARQWLVQDGDVVYVPESVL